MKHKELTFYIPCNPILQANAILGSFKIYESNHGSFGYDVYLAQSIPTKTSYSNTFLGTFAHIEDAKQFVSDYLDEELPKYILRGDN